MAIFSNRLLHNMTLRFLLPTHHRIIPPPSLPYTSLKSYKSVAFLSGTKAQISVTFTTQHILSSKPNYFTEVNSKPWYHPAFGCSHLLCGKNIKKVFRKTSAEFIPVF